MVYHVEWYYDKDNVKRYYVFPSSIRGVLRSHFGFEIWPPKWRVDYIPWYDRYLIFFEWVWYSRFSKKSAQKLADKLNKKITNRK